MFSEVKKKICINLQGRCKEVQVERKENKRMQRNASVIDTHVCCVCMHAAGGT